jgi:hypothetical protein
MSLLGRHIDIITGRNGYSISKEKHAEMLKNDGMYLFLEKTPEEIRNRPYDKAFILPARVADTHFATNNPAKIKSSFSLAGDTLRFKFYSQMHKIYEFDNPSLNIRLFPMTTSRKNFRVYRDEWEFMKKKDGVYMFVCTSPTGQLIDVVLKPAHAITFSDGNRSKEIPIDLSGEGVGRLMVIQSSQKREYFPEGIANAIDHPHSPDVSHPEKKQTQIQDYIDAYLTNGLPIILTFPEGKESLQVTCTITGTKKVPRG